MHRPLIAVLVPLFAMFFAPPTSAAGEIVALVSDLEGDIGKFKTFLSAHPAFEPGSDGRFHLRPEARFAYGGDVPDRFFGERQLLRELLRLKEEAPERVLLIAGNRDVNKLRLPLELSPRALAAPPWRHARAFRTWCAKNGRRDSAATRLRWILEQTMGAPDAFELRRRELAFEAGVEMPGISDEAIVESYLADASPGGLFHRYLRAARLGERLGGGNGSTLIVHAGLPQAAMGHIPGVPRRIASLDHWLSGLDAWYRSQLEEWERGVSLGSGEASPPGKLLDAGAWSETHLPPANALMRYVEKWGGQPANPFSVAYGRTVDAEGKVALPPQPVIAWLRDQGIRRLIVGHTPSGQVPVLLRTPDAGFEHLVLDTSYGLPDAVPLVSLHGSDGAVTEVRGACEPSPGSRLSIAFQLPFGSSGPLGRTLADGSIVVAPIEGQWLSYRLAPGYKVRYEIRSDADARH